MIGANRKIDALMEAIAEHEGWNPPDADSTSGGSRAYRNHNPGNLRSSPYAHSVVDGFAVFRNDFVGFMALHWDLMQKAKGNTVTGLNGQSSIRDLIYKWAPPSDNNDTEAYVRSVEKYMGVPASTTLAEVFEMN
jgi:hypothetical protein